MTSDDVRSHVLLVAFRFPPSRQPGSDRAVAVAHALVERGWRVTALTADEQTLTDFDDHDPSTSDLIDPSLAVVRVPLQHPRHQLEIDRWDEGRAADPVPWMEDWDVAEQAVFPERNYGRWTTDLELAAARIHAERSVDLVLTMCAPQACGAVGAHLATQHGVPHVLDQQSPWRIDLHSERLRAPAGSPEADAEQAILASARRVWVPNEPLADLHRTTHPDLAGRERVVPQGFDPESVRSDPPAPRGPGEPAVYGLLGGVLDRMPLAALLQGWVAMLEDGQPAELRVRGDIGLNPNRSSQVESLLIDAQRWGVTHQRPAPRSTRSDDSGDVDVFVLLVPSSRYATPPVLSEYMATGRPIVSVHATEHPALDDLRDYPRWFPAASLRPRDIAATLVAARLDAWNTDPTPAARGLDHAGRFSWESVLSAPIDELHGIVSGEVR